MISGIVLAGFVVAYFCFPAQFEAAAHWVAAVMIFVIIGAVVFINAYLVSNQDKQDPATRERFRRRYRVIGWMMVGSAVGALIVALAGRLSDLEGGAWNIPVFALETALLLEFALFWAFQTFELWDHADRNTLISDERQETLAPIVNRAITPAAEYRGLATGPASSPAVAHPSSPSCGCRSRGT